MRNKEILGRLEEYARKTDCSDDREQEVSNLACRVHTMLGVGGAKFGRQETALLWGIAEKVAELAELSMGGGTKPAGRSLGRGTPVPKKAPEFRDRRWY